MNPVASVPLAFRRMSYCTEAAWRRASLTLVHPKAIRFYRTFSIEHFIVSFRSNRRIWVRVVQEADMKLHQSQGGVKGQ